MTASNSPLTFELLREAIVRAEIGCNRHGPFIACDERIRRAVEIINAELVASGGEL